ncbi:unnamed protein product [Paramecium primaurelia]|uniref:Uncharacterized protein n=1 Tax=Paramecium primaurelia TaxID=5886 RepID=A0A8S1JUK2_PARPR|nr:unnamed protein product [Paramecium primaurelia]
MKIYEACNSSSYYTRIKETFLADSGITTFMITESATMILFTRELRGTTWCFPITHEVQMSIFCQQFCQFMFSLELKRGEYNLNWSSQQSTLNDIDCYLIINQNFQIFLLKKLLQENFTEDWPKLVKSENKHQKLKSKLVDTNSKRVELIKEFVSTEELEQLLLEQYINKEKRTKLASSKKGFN